MEKPLVSCLTTDARHQIQLPAHLVPDERIGLGLGPPIGQQLIRVLAAVGQPERYASEITYQSGRKCILTINGEDHCGIESRIVQPFDQGDVRAGMTAIRRRLHPGGLIHHHVVDPGDEGRRSRPGIRGQERDPALRARLPHGPERGRSHQDITHRVETDTEHVSRIPPRSARGRFMPHCSASGHGRPRASSRASRSGPVPRTALHHPLEANSLGAER